MAVRAKASARITNKEYLDLIASKSSSFMSHTAKGTYDILTKRGFTQLAAESPQDLVDFFGIPTRAALQIVNIAHARDPLAERDFGEEFSEEYGGYLQRLAVEQIDPVTPAFIHLEEGKSVDQQIVRKPKSSSRFYRQNFDYQSLVTLKEAYLKQAFVSEYGIDEFIGGIMSGLEAGYIKQKYLTKLAAINEAINDDNMKDTQIIPVSVTDWKNKDQMLEVLYTISTLIETMSAQSSSGAYNMSGFDTIQDKSRLRILVRPGFLSALKMYTLAGTFNPEELDIGVPFIPVENFGGITYALEDGTPLYPVYSAVLGNMIGYSTTENSTEATYAKNDARVKAVDHNSDVLFAIADKGFVFTTICNPYTVRIAPYNSRGLYLNYIPEAHGNYVDYDRSYTFLVGKNQASA